MTEILNYRTCSIKKFVNILHAHIIFRYTSTGIKRSKYSNNFQKLRFTIFYDQQFSGFLKHLLYAFNTLLMYLIKL